MKILKGIGVFLLICLVVVAGYFIFMTVTDYQPDDVIVIDIDNKASDKVEFDNEYSALIFNIGYCCLDKSQDFFMDGGTGSRPDNEEVTIKNLSAISKFVKEQDADFIMLQEVDENSSRSFRINEYQDIKSKLTGYDSTFAINYKVPWVPVPITKPYGKVKSGLAMFSKYKLDSATRYQLPGKEKWPRQLALLDRCFIESKMKLENGKELIMLNVHLSAYDKGGLIRKEQLGFLKGYLEKEYDKGNYVVVGGDWNHLIPGTDMEIFKNVQQWPEWLQKIPEDFKPNGFKWVLDKNIATNRVLDAPYKKGESYISIIDGYLVSPNVDVTEVKGYMLDFENSDHNPVMIKFKLK